MWSLEFLKIRREGRNLGEGSRGHREVKVSEVEVLMCSDPTGLI